MRKMSNTRWWRPRLLWLLLFLGGGGISPYLNAQAPGREVREFDPARLERFRNDPRFKYRRDTPEPPKKKPKRKQKKESLEYRPPRVRAPRADLSGFGKSVLWVLIIGGGIFLIAQVLKVRFGKLVKKKSDEAEVIHLGEIEEDVDIRNIEFESLLDKAIREKRFRYAIRLLYLQSLRQLSEKGLIAWQQEKTNHEYLRELRNSSIRPQFSEVTLLFEYIWYGEFPLDKDHFHTARGSFIQFEQALRKTDAG